jgi:hypothetical protein
MPDTIWETVLSWGPGAIGFILLYLLVRTGDLRTRWEVVALERQITRAEEQVQDLAETVRDQARQHQQHLDAFEELVAQLHQRRPYESQK